MKQVLEKSYITLSLLLCLCLALLASISFAASTSETARYNQLNKEFRAELFNTRKTRKFNKPAAKKILDEMTSLLYTIKSRCRNQLCGDLICMNHVVLKSYYLIYYTFDRNTSKQDTQLASTMATYKSCASSVKANPHLKSSLRQQISSLANQRFSGYEHLPEHKLKHNYTLAKKYLAYLSDVDKSSQEYQRFSATFNAFGKYMRLTPAQRKKRKQQADKDMEEMVKGMFGK